MMRVKILIALIVTGLNMESYAKNLFHPVAYDDALSTLPNFDSVDSELQLLSGKKITAIDIIGIVDETQHNNAEVFLGLMQIKDEVIEQPSYVNYLITHGEKEIAKSQQPFGYYQAKVSSETLVVSDDGLKVIYHVNLGVPTKIRAMDVSVTGEAQNDPVFQKILGENPLHQGEILSHAEYEKYKALFLAQAIAHGYFDGAFTNKVIEVNTDNNQADIHLHYDSGQRFVFKRVKFSPAKGHDSDEIKPIPLDDDLLQRFVQFQSDQPYDIDNVEQLQQDLQGSGYFRQALVGGHPDSNTKGVPIDAQLTMNSNKHYALGVGYSTDTGVRGKFDFDWRWVNSRGHKFSTSLYASQKESSWDNIYRIPAQNPATDYYYVRFGGWIKDDDYESHRGFLEGGYNWRQKKWEYRLSGVAAWEKFTIGNDKDEILLTYPILQATYTSTKNRLNPETGFQAKFRLMGGIENLGSDMSFIQSNVNLRYIQTLDPKNRLIFRFDGGSTWTDDFHRLPPSLRYFAGGDRSVRGYAYQKLGEYDSTSTNIGAKNYAVASAEYEYYFRPEWAVATFVDVGDAFNHDFEPYYGAGVGMHWRSPVGPIKIDLGHGFDDDLGDKIRLHLTIGAELDL